MKKEKGENEGGLRRREIMEERREDEDEECRMSRKEDGRNERMRANLSTTIIGLYSLILPW
jgi:hypothetical protein